jgi:hypothetical protein
MLEDIIIPEDPTPGEVVKLIAKTSALMSRASELAVNAGDEYRQAKSNHKLIRSKAYLTASGTGEERKAKAMIAAEEAKQEMLVAEAKWRMLEAKHEEYRDLLVSLRSIKSIKETEMRL